MEKQPKTSEDLLKPSSGLAVRDLPISLVIFLVALVLRLLEVDVPINADEELWMYRGTAFALHLFEGDLAGTYLRHHPGVTNMWLTGSSMFLNCLWHKLHPQFWGIDQPASVGACLNVMSFPIGLWILPRIFQAIVTAGCIVAIYDLVRRLIGRPIALMTIGLLMLEPFFLAYQRYLTTDALQSSFGAVGLLAMLLYLKQPLGQVEGATGRPRKWLLLSGVMTGLSILSKIPSVFVIPAVLTWLIVIELRNGEAALSENHNFSPQGSFSRRGWPRQGLDFVLWLMTIGMTAFLIWPALWVAPIDTLTQLLTGLREESTRGAFFYLGQTTDVIGPSFYPLVLFYRLSPIFLLGLVIAVIMAFRHRGDRQHSVFLLLLMVIGSLWMLGMLSIIGSKIDRYISLVIPLLAVLSATGWVWLWTEARVKPWQRLPISEPASGFFLGRSSGKGTAPPRRSLAAGMVGLLLVQSVVVVIYQPNYLTYFNPLAQLIYPAERVFMIGQGEGLDQAARWINRSPEAKDMTVAAWYASAFHPYFEGNVVPIPKVTETTSPLWLNTHRVALYINQYQRDLPEREMLDYFSAQPLLHSVRFHGLDYVKIYPGPVATPGDLAAIAEPQSVKVSDRIQFYGHELKGDRPTPDQALQVTTYWEFADALPAESKLVLTLKNSTDEISTTADRLMGGYIAMDKVPQNIPLRESQTIPLETLSPGRYNLTASWQVPAPQQPAASYKLSLGSVEIGAGS
ncbi:glycosyltransferase family 39 protein [Leptolyngbya sp. BC1307]|uniref:glycosyltransferase family 39 protein n=1 Tax=Leptolyngbya sp. BC1307 TaxID=2029589 RepID=UPI0014825686|nr:glycosyltransferase family 39 protein [Leptolyngbya sp. BC1307]